MEAPLTRMEQLRQERGLTYREIETATKIPRTTVERIHKGQRVTQREHARRLYEFYDYVIDLADIYDPRFDIEVAGAK